MEAQRARPRAAGSRCTDFPAPVVSGVSSAVVGPVRVICAEPADPVSPQTLTFPQTAAAAVHVPLDRLVGVDGWLRAQLVDMCEDECDYVELKPEYDLLAVLEKEIIAREAAMPLRRPGSAPTWRLLGFGRDSRVHFGILLPENSWHWDEFLAAAWALLPLAPHSAAAAGGLLEVEVEVLPGVAASAGEDPTALYAIFSERCWVTSEAQYNAVRCHV